MDNIKEEILATAKFVDQKKMLYLMRGFSAFFAVMILFQLVSEIIRELRFSIEYGFDFDFNVILIYLSSLLIPAFFWWMSNLCKPKHSPQLFVTKTHIYGCYLFKKHTFDFPIEKITAVQTVKPLITGRQAWSYLFLSSGGERVLGLEKIINADELKHVISNLIKENSEKVQKVEVVNTVTTIQQSKDEKSEAIQNKSETLSSADEIKKFKELYDQGIITEEEFNAKKKQLLGL